MRCESVVEVLPWFLARNLDDEQMAAVESHLTQCPSCGQEAVATRRAAEIMTAHLPTLVIAEYALGLPSSDEELSTIEIESHLASCSRCRAELAMVQMDEDLDEAEHETPATVIDFAARRRLSAPSPTTTVSPSPAMRWAVAAGVTAALGGSLMLGNLGEPEIVPVPVSEVQAHPAVEAPGAAGRDEGTVFSDGFESGDLGRWQLVVEEG